MTDFKHVVPYPMKSVPKDGTEILAWHIDGGNWHQVKWKNGDFRMRWNDNYMQCENSYSKWTPLPNPPEDL